MAVAIRIFLVAALILGIGGVSSAQEEEATGTAAATETTVTAAAGTATATDTAAAGTPPPRSSFEIRSRFTGLLRDRPPEVATILRLDPSLLSDASFLAKYPEIAAFVTEHPEVRHNPNFYFAEFQEPKRYESPVSEVLEGLTIFAVFTLIAFVLAWLVRTIIEQRRWNRLTRTQSEVHTKILDRFSTSAELLDYIRTPAGSKFLESAPIPLRAEPAAPSAPLTRVLWSVQIGIVVAAASIGLLLVHGRFEREAAGEVFALGMIGLCLGAGFVGSAAVSIFLSRRLGLWQGPDAPPAERRVDEPGVVR